MSVRSHMMGMPDKPRLAVFRSHKYISAQLIDDVAGRTIASASSMSADSKAGGKKGIEAASLVGRQIGKSAKQAGIKGCVFDRRHYKYHGRIKAVADGAREEGLRF